MNKARDYLIEKCCNCAETVLHCLDDEWELNCSPDCFRAIGAFGGGAGCGELCGALAGGIAAIGLKYIQSNAHACPKAKEKAAAFTTEFKAFFGSEKCSILKPVYQKPDIRCLELVEQTLELLKEY